MLGIVQTQKEKMVPPPKRESAAFIFSIDRSVHRKTLMRFTLFNCSWSLELRHQLKKKFRSV